MFRFSGMAIILTGMMLFATGAFADPIVGNWTTDNGAIAQIEASAGGFTITLRSGDHNGKQIGQLQPSGTGQYTGTITDPSNNKTYSGNATLNGDQLALQGCVAVMFCRTQNWQRR